MQEPWNLLIRAVINMQLCWHVIDMRKTMLMSTEKVFFDMLFLSNDTLNDLRNNEIPSNFSRGTMIISLCRPSFILRLQCALYFWVCSISQLFVLWILMNQSCQSPHPEVDMVIKLAIRSNGWYLYKVSNRIICRYMSMTSQDFLQICWHEKRSQRQL